MESASGDLRRALGGPILGRQLLEVTHHAVENLQNLTHITAIRCDAELTENQIDSTFSSFLIFNELQIDVIICNIFTEITMTHEKNY